MPSPPGAAPAGGSEQVRRYYDENAVVFERHAKRTSIHRAIWGPGVQTEDQAFHHVDELIVETLRSVLAHPARAQASAPPTVVDLGCGIGASLLYIASRLDIIGEGITISPAQAARAAELIASTRPSPRVRCREGNYLSLPADLATVDLAFSIEAFVHSPDAQQYFNEAARILRPGGRLVVCDDVLAPGVSADDVERDRRLREFRQGWHVGSLVTVGQASELAAAAGLRLVSDVDLTPYLHLRRPRDLLASVLVVIGQRLPFLPFFPFRGAYWDALVGGNALQLALVKGTLEHRFLVFERG